MDSPLNPSGVTPTIETMVRRLDAVEPLRGVFGRGKSLVWRGLSDLAHSGMQQVYRWAGDGEIAPRHSDDEVLYLISMAEVFALFSCIGIVGVAGVPADAHVAQLQRALSAFQARKTAFRPPAAE